MNVQSTMEGVVCRDALIPHQDITAAVHQAMDLIKVEKIALKYVRCIVLV